MNPLGRPIKHPISGLIKEEAFDEARSLLQAALLEGGGTTRGAGKVLDAAEATVWRWMNKLGMISLYDGRAGSDARWTHEREKKKILAEINARKA